MLPYIGIIWDAADSQREHVSQRLMARIRNSLVNWQVALDQHGLFVAVRIPASREIDEIYTLNEGHGVILGKMFEQSYVDMLEAPKLSPKRVILDSLVSREIVVNDGDTLRDRYWGRYVAFLASARARCVLRDPTGGIPCQQTMLDGVDVYFSRLSDLELICSVPSSINRHFIIGSLLLHSIWSGETAYSDISTVLPGERVRHGASGQKTKEFYWDPLQVAKSGAASVLADAPRTARRIVRRCIHAWASCAESIALQLSGGLDSSIVAACLADAPTHPNVLCLNSYHSRETTDERLFAREVATRYGFELHEIHNPGRQSLDLSAPRERTVIPISIVAPSSRSGEVEQLLLSHDVTCVLRGDGGDELFYRDGALPDAVDEAFFHGVSRNLWRIAMNDAVIQRTSIWEVLRLTLRHGLCRRPYDWRYLGFARNSHFFPEDIRYEACRDKTHWHPLFRETESCPPGKLLQAYRLLPFTALVYRESPAGRTALTPLVSQPHMEFALAAPLSLLRMGCRDRGLARSAFSDSVPEKILTRKYKSLRTTPSRARLASSLNAARELLLDGYLTREGIVDRNAVERCLTGNALTDQVAADLTSFLCVEVWLRGSVQSSAS